VLTGTPFPDFTRREYWYGTHLIYDEGTVMNLKQQVRPYLVILQYGKGCNILCDQCCTQVNDNDRRSLLKEIYKGAGITREGLDLRKAPRHAASTSLDWAGCPGEQTCRLGGWQSGQSTRDLVYRVAEPYTGVIMSAGSPLDEVHFHECW
jgi:hypothetical protein